MIFRAIPIIFLLFTHGNVFASNLIDVYQKTLEFNPSLKQAESIRLSTLQASPQATAKFYPTLNFQADITNNNQKLDYDDNNFPDFSDNYRSYGLGISLRQSLLNLSQYNRVKQADVIVASAEIQFATFYQDLMFNIILAYFEFLASTDNLSQYLAEKELTLDFLNQTIERYKNGEVAIVDTHDVQARFDSVITKINFANIRVEAAREVLRKLTGEYFVNLSLLKNDIPFLYPEPSEVKIWVDRALSDNLSILSDRLAIQAAQLDLDYQKKQNYPTIDIVGNYNLYNNSDLKVGGGDTRGSTIGLQLYWNIYQGGLNRSYISQSRHTLNQIKMGALLKTKEIEEQVRSAHFLIYSEINRINELYRAMISHQQALTANEIAYELKTRSIRDLLISIEQLSDIKRDYAQARYNYLIQYLTLHKLAGLLDQELMKKINSLMEN